MHFARHDTVTSTTSDPATTAKRGPSVGASFNAAPVAELRRSSNDACVLGFGCGRSRARGRVGLPDDAGSGGRNLVRPQGGPTDGRGRRGQHSLAEQPSCRRADGPRRAWSELRRPRLCGYWGSTLILIQTFNATASRYSARLSVPAPARRTWRISPIASCGPAINRSAPVGSSGPGPMARVSWRPPRLRTSITLTSVARPSGAGRSPCTASRCSTASVRTAEPPNHGVTNGVRH